MRKPKIVEPYKTNRDELENSSSVAHAFLLSVEEAPLWLSTATNAHLYLNDSFLAYLKIKSPELKPPSLLLSPHYNNRIWDTTDRSDLLCRTVLDELLTRHGEGWWEKRARNAVELSSKTPTAFFDDLLVALRGLRR